MTGLQVSLLLSFLLALSALTARGERFYGPYDVYTSRAARWPDTREASKGASTGDNSFPNSPDAVQDYFRIISYLNDVGRRRR